MRPHLPFDPARALVERFNRDDVEDVVNLVPNAAAGDWLDANAPRFDCPDPVLVETYYYRWWTYRKHLKQTPAGRIVTEFITDVRHAGSYNSISCAAGFHLAEGRWLREQAFLDEYTRFWFRMDAGKPEPKFHHYSSWLPWAMWQWSHVAGDTALLIELLDDLVADYAAWEAERLLPTGLFWQYDVRDAMEESISGSRTHRNARPTINSYMYGNARAIADIAHRAGRPDVAEQFAAKATALRQRVHATLWDESAQFFKAQTEGAGLCAAREAIGFIPWMFDLPDRACDTAWAQLIDPMGFWAPFGLTTAERRHPRFRSHGVGRCEWDGAVWPFATSQTLYGLANVLRRPPSPDVPGTTVRTQHFFDAMSVYARAQRRHGAPYVGEYLCEVTGAWLKGEHPRSRYYNHSTFNDLVITGLVGLVPRPDDVLELSPLVPADAWEWFCLDDVPYRGHRVAVLWDRFGHRFGRGPGLRVVVDGSEVAHAAQLENVQVPLT
jgi:hypothetical protein